MWNRVRRGSKKGVHKGFTVGSEGDQTEGSEEVSEGGSEGGSERKFREKVSSGGVLGCVWWYGVVVGHWLRFVGCWVVVFCILVGCWLVGWLVGWLVWLKKGKGKGSAWTEFDGNCRNCGH